MPSTFYAVLKGTKDCPNPPTIDWESVLFKSFFESESSQLICWQDSRGVHLAGSDLGWNQIFTYQLSDLRGAIQLPFSASERLWASACFTSILGGGETVNVGRLWP